jgi:hypothetical protein
MMNSRLTMKKWWWQVLVMAVVTTKKLRVKDRWRCHHITNTRRGILRKNSLWDLPNISRIICMVAIELREWCLAWSSLDKRAHTKTIRIRELPRINRRHCNLSTILWYMREKDRDQILHYHQSGSNLRGRQLNLSFKLFQLLLLRNYIITRDLLIACMFNTLFKQITSVIHAQ